MSRNRCLVRFVVYSLMLISFFKLCFLFVVYLCAHGTTGIEYFFIVADHLANLAAYRTQSSTWEWLSYIKFMY